MVTLHVDDDPIRVSDKETANAPRLVRQWINDLKAKRNGLGMHCVNILNRESRNFNIVFGGFVKAPSGLADAANE